MWNHFFFYLFIYSCTAVDRSHIGPSKEKSNPPFDRETKASPRTRKRQGEKWNRQTWRRVLSTNDAALNVSKHFPLVLADKFIVRHDLGSPSLAKKYIWNSESCPVARFQRNPRRETFYLLASVHFDFHFFRSLLSFLFSPRPDSFLGNHRQEDTHTQRETLINEWVCRLCTPTLTISGNVRIPLRLNEYEIFIILLVFQVLPPTLPCIAIPVFFYFILCCKCYMNKQDLPRYYKTFLPRFHDFSFTSWNQIDITHVS